MSDNAPIRLGCIDYLNALPFYHGLAERLAGEAVEFVHGVPAELNRMMREGEMDAALVSSLEYGLGADRYYALTDGCIASAGETESVILFSKHPVQELDGKTIALSPESLSSAALLKILLKFRWHFENSFRDDLRDVGDMLGEGEAALLIGDQALCALREWRWFTYDLCRLWSQWQGLPFCFAIWVVSRALAERCPDRVRRIGVALEQNVRANLDELDTVLGQRPDLADRPLPHSGASRYLRRLTYELNPETLEGLGRFYELARQMQFLDREIVLEYAEPSALEV